MRHNLTLKQKERFLEFVNMDDIQFYDTYISQLSEEAQIRFIQETPDFLSDIVEESDSVDLATDPIYQKLMKQIHDMKDMEDPAISPT